MANNRQIIEQIIEVRGRRGSGFPSSELFSRLLHLEAAYSKRAEQPKEVLKHYPIALVACMESYFRLSIKELIDSDSRFLDRAEKLVARFKFDFEVVKALHGKRITIGELVSHIVPLNNLADLDSQMSELLTTNFLQEVAGAHDRWAVEVQGKPKEPIIKDSGTVYRGVAKTFELRHIFCHEFATGHDYEITAIEECFDSSVIFLKASDEYLSEVLHPNAPLTQADMNEVSANKFREEREKLAQLNEKLLSCLDSERQQAYGAVHKAWETFMELSVRFEGSQFEGGSIRPTIENSAAAILTRSRVEEVERLIEQVTNV